VCPVQALDTLRSPCRQRVIPKGQAKQELVVVPEQIRAEVRDRVRYLIDMKREELDLVAKQSTWKRCRCSI
jgi:hypothetical protein